VASFKNYNSILKQKIGEIVSTDLGSVESVTSTARTESAIKLVSASAKEVDDDGRYIEVTVTMNRGGAYVYGIDQLDLKKVLDENSPSSSTVYVIQQNKTEDTQRANTTTTGNQYDDEFIYKNLVLNPKTQRYHL